MILKTIVGNTTLLIKHSFSIFPPSKRRVFFFLEQSFVLFLTLGPKESKVQKDT